MGKYSEILKKALSRFTKPQIITEIMELSYFQDEDSRRAVKNLRENAAQLLKTEVIDILAEMADMADVEFGLIGKLKLKVVQDDKSRMDWNIYSIDGGGKVNIHRHDPEEIAIKMKDGLKSTYKLDIFSEVVGGCLYFFVLIAKRLKGRSRFGQVQQVFIVHKLGTSNLASTINVSNSLVVKEAVIEEFLNAVGLDSCSLVELKGSKVHDLLEFAERTDPKKLTLMEDAAQKSRLLAKKSKGEDEDDDDVSEKKQARVAACKKVHIAEEPLPRLQRLTYELRGNYAGNGPSLQGMEFNCTVHFEGPSVLSGMREMVESGIMSLPLPKHMALFPTSGKNKFVLKSKERKPKDN